MPGAYFGGYTPPTLRKRAKYSSHDIGMNNFRSFCRLECAKSFITCLTSVQILFVVTNILTRWGPKSRFHTEDGRRFRVDSAVVCYESQTFSEKSYPRTIKISRSITYRWFSPFYWKINCKKRKFFNTFCSVSVPAHYVFINYLNARPSTKLIVLVGFTIKK